MTDLHEHLVRLADQAESPDHAATGRDLWARGRRYQRRRRAGTAVIAGVAAALVLAIGSVTWQRGAQPPVVAPAGAPVGLPSQVYEPSRWLPGTDGQPPGQLIAIMSAERGQWWGSEYETVGISAAAGEYRFLDLPDEASDTDPSLAPDGHHVAYWTTGPTTGSPNTAGGQSDTVAGVAVYDTVTGEVQRHPIETEHGLWDSLLVWVDEDTLAIDFSQYAGGEGDSDMDQSSGREAPGLRWDLGSEPVPFPVVDGLSVGLPAPPSTGGRAAFYTEDGLGILSDDGLVARGRTDAVDSQTVAVNPSGTLAVGVAQRGGRNPNRVMVAAVPAAGGGWDFEMLPDSDRSFRAVGWRDDDHVLVERRVGGGFSMRSGIYSVDARTGEADLLLEQPEGSFRGTRWAGDLLGAPVVDRPEPPSPLDPRVTVGLLVVTLGTAGFLIVRWRRRVEP